MEVPTSSAVRSMSALRRILEEAAQALVSADLTRLLACEGQLQAALSDLSGRPAASLDITDAARAQLTRDVALARTALARCRRHGQALDEVVRIGLAALGVHEDYGPRGAGAREQRHTLHRTA